MTDILFQKYELRPELQETLETKGFLSPTPVQEKVLEQQDLNTDLIVRAKTGSGKTLAFLLPIFNEDRMKNGSPKVLVLSPTRELALQIAREADWLGRNMHLRIASLVGGTDMSVQIKDLRRGASVVVGTPGRTLDHLRRGTLKLEDVHTVVLDEGDHMLDMGFREELEGILDSAPLRERTWLFSATMPEEVVRLSRRYLSDPETISLVDEGEQHSEIAHRVYMVPRHGSLDGLVNVLLWEDSSRGLIFCHTRAQTLEVTERLQQEGFKVCCINGDFSQRERNQSLASFKSGRVSLLVATNVAARGIDVPGVKHVFQFGLPDDLDTFIHRSGRTGRAGNKGRNILILNLRETSRFKSMVQRTRIDLEWLPVPDGDDIKARNRAIYEEKMLNQDLPEKKDIHVWAESIISRTDPVHLVTRLLQLADRKIPGGYDLRKELQKEMAAKKPEPLKERTTPSRGRSGKRERTQRERGTEISLKLLNTSGWNVGRVLRSVCSSLDVDRKEVAQITLLEDSVKVELLDLAYEKYTRNPSSLKRWGLVPEETTPKKTEPRTSKRPARTPRERKPSKVRSR